MSVANLWPALVFDEAIELTGRLLEVADPDELADLIEHVVDHADRAHAVVFLLTMRARGVDITDTAVELANTPATGRLILPPGVEP